MIDVPVRRLSLGLPVGQVTSQAGRNATRTAGTAAIKIVTSTECDLIFRQFERYGTAQFKDQDIGAGVIWQLCPFRKQIATCSAIGTGLSADCVQTPDQGWRYPVMRVTHGRHADKDRCQDKQNVVS